MTVLSFITLTCGLAADGNLEKAQRKAMEAQVKTMTGEALKLEKSGRLAQARSKYAESQGLIEVKAVTESLKRVDGEILKRVKAALGKARTLYEARKFREAAGVLDEAMKLEAFQPVVFYDLALCYHQLGERDKAMEYLLRAKPGTVEPKQRQKLLQLQTLLTTGENGAGANAGDKDRIGKLNQMAESIGLDASVEEEIETASVRTSRPGGNNSPRKNLCGALGDAKDALLKSPAATFNLANCAETNGRTEEAVTLLTKYLEMAPKAFDAEESRARIGDLQAQLRVAGGNGVEVRRLHASADGALSERQYERALAAYKKAGELEPAFALTKWKMALLYEALGNIEQAREQFVAYRELSSDQSAKDEAELHLSTLDAKRTKYDEEVDATGDIIGDLFNRGMNLTFNGSEKRSALRAKRALVKNKNDQGKARGRVGGFAVPFAYAQQQLGRASEHLQTALAIFPLGAGANELMGLVYLQGNDGPSATKSFDVVASQGLPVSFYAEMRGQKQDQAVKCELNRDGFRLIFLSSYDKKGKPAAPSKPAGEDGLGDLVVEPGTARQEQFGGLTVKSGEIKRVETEKGLLKIKLAQREIRLSPIYLASYTPIEGPPARRFANNYTRMFVRYPGLEDSKLGTEGMSGGEKFAMGYKLATAGVDMAMSGFSPIGAISSIQDAVSIARTIRTAMGSLKVSFASWSKSVNDQQHLLAGKAFKTIPWQAANLGFAQEVK